MRPLLSILILFAVIESAVAVRANPVEEQAMNCWLPPRSTIGTLTEPAVMVRIGPDGHVDDMRASTEVTSDPTWRATVEAMARAVHTCGPYDVDQGDYQVTFRVGEDGSATGFNLLRLFRR